MWRNTAKKKINDKIMLWQKIKQQKLKIVLPII